MIVKYYILSTIEELDKLYNKARSQKKAIYYSKLALLELCGWIEESMDDIVLSYGNRTLKQKSNKEYIKKQIVPWVHGFQYQQHFRPMLMSVIGIRNLERVETKLEYNGGQVSRLSSFLGNLKSDRNDAAHTFLKGITRTYNAPSRTKGDFLSIYPILKEFDNEIRKL